MTQDSDVARHTPERRERVGLGILLRLLSALLISATMFLLKLATSRGVVAVELLFYRAVFALPVVLVWTALGQGVGALGTKRPLAHVGRSLLGMISILCAFQALILLPLSDAITITFVAPIFATLLSAPLLGERIGRHRWLAVIAGFGGVAIVLRPGSTGHGLASLGVLVGLAGAVGTAGVTITLRRLGNTENAVAIVFWFFAGSAAIGGLFLPFLGHRHDMDTLLLLAGGGAMGGLSQMLMTTSLRLAPVAVLSPFDYFQLVGALVLGWTLMASVPTMNTLIGAAIIGASGLYTGWREQRRTRTILPPVPPAIA